MGKVYKIGTRASELALKQVDEVISLIKNVYPDIMFDITAMDTYGDKDKQTPISEIEGTDFFTKEIDTALIKGDIDIAVHSAKDLPDVIDTRLKIGALTKSVDPFDALVSKNNLTLAQLPKNAKVATSSKRRKAQLLKYRSDFNIVDIRGTIQERLDIFDRSDIDAVIIASCALKRLGLDSRIAQIIPFEIMSTHSWQGALAVMVRVGDEDIEKIVSSIDNRKESVL